MHRAVWGIFYDVGDADRDDYLAWFHDVHIPEKLARPGYEWAAHYAAIAPDGSPGSVLGEEAGPHTSGYVALFGGTDTRVFLDPSPAQIKPRQTEETRMRMGQRIGSRSFIASLEWQVAAAIATAEAASLAMQMTLADAGSADEDFGAYCVQERAPRALEAVAFERISKFLTATGPVKHVLLEGFASLDGLTQWQTDCRTEWRERLAPNLIEAPGTPLTARRIWPLQ